MVTTLKAIQGNLPGGQLYEYQIKAVERIATLYGRALIADEMGLGKTPTALAWLFRLGHMRPALIVCPAPSNCNGRDRPHGG